MERFPVATAELHIREPFALQMADKKQSWPLSLLPIETDGPATDRLLDNKIFAADVFTR